MIFIEWWVVKQCFIGLLMMAVGVFGFWLVREQRWLVRGPARLISGLVILWGMYSFLVAGGGYKYSVPVYSPSQKIAARIDRYDPGELGGPTFDAVKVFSSHGFTSDVVFSGQWESVEPKGIRWKSDSELEISYQGTEYLCASTLHVRVRCIENHAVFQGSCTGNDRKLPVVVAKGLSISVWATVRNNAVRWIFLGRKLSDALPDDSPYRES
jgi:hypothetical protein